MAPKSKPKSESGDKDEQLSQINSKLDLILQQLVFVNTRLDSLESKQKEYESSLNYIHEDMDDLKQRVSEVEKAAPAEQQLETLKAINERIRISEHQSRAKNLELNGIPYKEGEELMEGFERIIKHLKYMFINPAADIDNIYRIRKSKQVIVKFVQARKRDHFFQHYRKKHNIHNSARL